jgi:hypothetical protein
LQAGKLQGPLNQGCDGWDDGQKNSAAGPAGFRNGDRYIALMALPFAGILGVVSYIPEYL